MEVEVNLAVAPDSGFGAEPRRRGGGDAYEKCDDTDEGPHRGGPRQASPRKIAAQSRTFGRAALPDLPPPRLSLALWCVVRMRRCLWLWWAAFALSRLPIIASFGKRQRDGPKGGRSRDLEAMVINVEGTRVAQVQDLMATLTEAGVAKTTRLPAGTHPPAHVPPLLASMWSRAS